MNPVIASSASAALSSLPSIMQSSTVIKTSLIAKTTLPLVVYSSTPPVGLVLFATVCMIVLLAAALSDCESSSVIYTSVPQRVHYVTRTPSYCSYPSFVGRVPTTRVIVNTPPPRVPVGERIYRDQGSRVPVGQR